MTRPDPALVAECFAENRPRLLATIELVTHALTLTTGKSDTPAKTNQRKDAAA